MVNYIRSLKGYINDKVHDLVPPKLWDILSSPISMDSPNRIVAFIAGAITIASSYGCAITNFNASPLETKSYTAVRAKADGQPVPPFHWRYFNLTKKLDRSGEKTDVKLYVVKKDGQAIRFTDKGNDETVEDVSVGTVKFDENPDINEHRNESYGSNTEYNAPNNTRKYSGTPNLKTFAKKIGLDPPTAHNVQYICFLEELKSLTEDEHITGNLPTKSERRKIKLDEIIRNNQRLVESNFK